MPENIELPGASHNKTNQVERAVDTPADFTSPEELYKDLIAAIKKYHPSTEKWSTRIRRLTRYMTYLQ